MVVHRLCNEATLGASFAETLLGLVEGFLNLFLLAHLLVDDVAAAVGGLSLFESYLLEDVVLARLPLLLLHQQVVGRGDLVVLVVLHVRGRLVQLLPAEVRPQVLQLLRDHWDAVLTHYYPIHLHAPALTVPVVRPYVLYAKPLGWVGLEYFLHDIFVEGRYETGDLVVAGKDLFVKLVRVGVFKGKVAAGHGVEDDAARPDVTSESVVALASYHFGCCVAWRAACRLEGLSLAVGVAEAKVDDLDVVALV